MNALVRTNPQELAHEPPANGAALYRVSTDAAALCRDIVLATASNIQGRRYVQVEGWQAIALAHGCAASSGNVVRHEDGSISAIGRVVRIDTGTLIASAEGYVGADEATWFGGTTVDRYGKTKVLAKRPDYAIRAMAQTRAISRACRSAFAHVVVMMNAGLSTTPAEEVPSDGFDHEPQRIPEQPPVSENSTPRPQRFPDQGPVSENGGDLQSARTAVREAAQAAAVTPPPKKQTIAEFLDQLDRELELAPEAAAVHAMMMSERITNARGFMTNGAGERLSQWTIRAGQKRAALQEAERQAAAPVVQEPPKASEMVHNTAPPPADPLNGPMPEAIDEWPMIENLGG